MIAVGTLGALHSRLIRELPPPTGRYLPLQVDGAAAGWLDEERARRLAAMPHVFEQRTGGLAFVSDLGSVEARTAALDGASRALAAEGRLTAWRDERYAVVPEFGATPWFLLERAAARFFGVRSFAAHVNGVVTRDGAVEMWLARRSPDKAIDPGMLDNLVGGGIAAGRSIAETVVKESWEEAGIPAPMARLAQPAGTIDICREQPDGLQRETVYVHDLALPATFLPGGQDGEVVEHRLVSLDDAAELIANGEGADVVTADASLVILDYLLRTRAIEPNTPFHRELEAMLHRHGPSPVHP